MASNEGKKFEKDIKQSAANQAVFCMRLNDTSLSWQHEKTSRFTPDSKCDYIIYHKPYMYAIECKSTTYKSITIQRDKNDEQKMIKAHQIKSLIDFSLEDGISAGFILNFRNDDDVHDNITYWLSISNFSDFLVENDKKSINANDVEKYGGIVVPQKLKRTRYIYDILALLELIQQENEKVNKKGGTDG